MVFHAFNNIEELAAHGRREGSFVRVFIAYYGPFLLAIFDATNAILAVLALVFTIALLRRNGELTALLAAGLCHGRVLRPMLLAALAVLVIAVVNRELVMPNWQDQLSAKAQDLNGELMRKMQPCYDRMTGIQFHGKGVIVVRKRIVSPTLMVRSEMPNIGPQIIGATADWKLATDVHPSGYLVNEVVAPKGIDALPSSGFGERQFVLTPKDYDWLEPGQCFIVSNVDFEHLRSGSNWKRLASSMQLIERIANPSVYTGVDTEVMLHIRLVRPLLDVSLILIGLPLVVLRGDRNVFLMAGWGLGLIAFFFAVKTVFSTLGSSETIVSPGMAAWGPILVFAPLAYSRYKAADRT